MPFTVQYYDLVLAAIGGSVMVGIGIGLVTAIALTTAVAGLSVVALALIVHALFVKGPVEDLDDLTEEVQPREVPGVARMSSIVE